jgi:hypothetical protein
MRSFKGAAVLMMALKTEIAAYIEYHLRKL